MAYNIIALIGKAGAGKDTILNAIKLKDHSNQFHKIVNYTTRPKRDKEIEGKDYYFIDDEEFLNKVLNGEIIGVARFNDWSYGTGYESFVEDKLNIGIFSIEVLEDLRRDENIKLFTFYINADDKIRMLRQLQRENEPDVDEIVRRYLTDKQDFKSINLPVTIINNNNNSDLEKAIKQIQDFF